jgi:uncharacterized membrane protein YcgQ (UPF0703/DUF1980 family)
LKKIFLIIVLFLLTGCDGAYGAYEEISEGYTPHVFEIESDDFDAFLERILEIHMNAERYFGETFRYQGLFFSSDVFDGVMRYFVLQFSEHCCGGGNMGFELALDGIEPFPDGTWVEVTGVLGECPVDGFIYLQATSAIEVPEPERAS